MTLKDYLSKFLSEEELDKVKTSYDTIGDIAIIEVPEGLEKIEKSIAEGILRQNKNIKTVLKKGGIHEGTYRTQGLEYVAGEDKKETVYTENKTRIKLNPEKVYFSPRLSTERQRLLWEIEPQRVLVMFSGVGPYNFVAYRYQPDHYRVTGIEINPEGHDYALQNIELNKSIAKKTRLFRKIKEYFKSEGIAFNEKEIMKRINYVKLQFINEDVKKEVPFLKFKKERSNKSPDVYIDEISVNESGGYEEHIIGIRELNDTNLIKFVLLAPYNKFIYNGMKFTNQIEKNYLYCLFEGLGLENIGKYDKILMPLPKDAELFLDEAFQVADKNCKVHMYDFVSEEEIPQVTETKVKEAARKKGKEVEIISTRKVGQYSPRKYRVCCDFLIK